jgi:hypothetical protein
VFQQDEFLFVSSVQYASDILFKSLRTFYMNFFFLFLKRYTFIFSNSIKSKKLVSRYYPYQG